MFSFNLKNAWLTAILITLANGGCADPVAPSQSLAPSKEHQDLWALIEALRPSASEIQNMLIQVDKIEVDADATSALSPGLRPQAAPTLAAIELTPMLMDSGGLRMLTDPTLTIAEIENGAIVILPYEVDYSDDTTAFEGILQIRFQWDAALSYFYPANPAYTFSELIDGPSAYIQGVVYNFLVDQLDGIAHDNGQLVDAVVYAYDADNHVYTARTGLDGAYALGPLPVGQAYTVVAMNDGYNQQRATFLLNTPQVVSGVDFDLMPGITSVTHTTHVYGRVVDLNGEPIWGAVVTMIDESSGQPADDLISRMTNANGEYMINHVRAHAGNAYHLEVLLSATSENSQSFSIASVNTPLMVEQNYVVDGYLPDVTCSADGQAGENITATVVAGATLDLAAYGSDPSGEPLYFRWSTPQTGSLDVSPLPELGFNTAAQFTVPAEPGLLRIEVYAHNPIGMGTCGFDISVVPTGGN